MSGEMHNVQIRYLTAASETSIFYCSIPAVDVAHALAEALLVWQTYTADVRRCVLEAVTVEVVGC